MLSRRFARITNQRTSLSHRCAGRIRIFIGISFPSGKDKSASGDLSLGTKTGIYSSFWRMRIAQLSRRHSMIGSYTDGLLKSSAPVSQPSIGPMSKLFRRSVEPRPNIQIEPTRQAVHVIMSERRAAHLAR